MKKRIVAFVLVFITFFVSGCLSSPSYEDVPVVIDDDVRRIVDLTNIFRHSSDAYYLNPDNKTVTSYVGQLGFLTLDEELCKAAAIRARETAITFSHTRPDGRFCISVANDLGIYYKYLGENLAAGYPDTERTFNQWREDKENYEGQGHRRNMLKPIFWRIGVAHYYDPDSEYKHYWAMILAQ